MTSIGLLFEPAATSIVATKSHYPSGYGSNYFGLVAPYYSAEASAIMRTAIVTNPIYCSSAICFRFATVYLSENCGPAPSNQRSACLPSYH